MIESEELPLVIDSDIHSKVPVVVEIIPAKGTDHPFVSRDFVNPELPLRTRTVSPAHQLSGNDLAQIKVDHSPTMVNSGGQGVQGRAETARQQQLGVVISCGRPRSDNDRVVYYATKDDGPAGDAGPQPGRQTPTTAYVEMPSIVIDSEVSAVEPTKAATASPPTQDLNYAEFADVSQGDDEEDGEGKEGASGMKAAARAERQGCGEEASVQVDGEQQQLQREEELPIQPLENFTREERAEGDPQLDLPADTQRRMQSQGLSRKRAKSSVKMKLVRSLAVCDEPSPPLAEGGSQESQEPQLESRNRKEEERPCKEGTGKEKPGEKVVSDKPEKSPKAQKVLSRDSSQDYTDSTGVDVHEFLVNTLRNNPRDRMMLLKMEQELTDFVQDNKQHYRKFPPMTSYHRMLVHRVAAYFGMDHNVDQTGKAVVVNKTPGTRIPEQRFSEHFKDDGQCDEAQKRFILKRDNSSLDKDDMQRIRLLQGERRSKSIEEREEEYQRARERIFAQDAISVQDTPQIEIRARKDSGRLSNGGRQSSTDTELRPSEPRPWSSTDSESSGHRLSRPAVTKASSFGGISVLVRGDSTSSSNKSSVGRLSKTGSESSSSVGSSSGSLARPAETSTTAAPSVPGPVPSSLVGSGAMAVGMGSPATSGPSYYLLHLDSAGIPPGSILINPQTGQPLLNADGSLAVYNPPTGQVQQQQQMGAQMVGPGTCQQLLHHRPNPQQRQQLPHQAAQCVALTSQPGSYPLASYAPSSATHHPAASAQPLMPVLHTQQQQHQQQQQYHTPEELGPHFGQMSLNRQTSAETLEAMQPHGHTPMLPVMVQGSQQPAYIGVSGISGLLHQGGFHMGAPAGPTAQGSTGPQPGLQQQQQQQHQQQGYGQAQQHGQMTVYFCPPSPYPPPGQQYQSGATMQYSGSRSQQPSYQPMGAVPQPTYVSMQPPPGQGGMPGQQGGLAHPMAGVLGSPVQGPVGNALQGMMSHYPPMSAYHMAQAAPQGPAPPPPPPQQQYQQPVLVSGQPHGAVPPMFCSVGQPGLQGNLSGSVVGYLQPPGMEQLQFPRTQSPAGAQPPHGQHYTVFSYVQGQRPPSPHVQQQQQHQQQHHHHHHSLTQAHRGPSAGHVPAGLAGGPPGSAPASHMGSKSPPAALTLVPGLSPGGHGVFLMQLSLPSGAHPAAHAPSPTRWGQRRGLSLDQRLPRGAELNHADSPVQGSPRLHSPMPSPSQSPSSTPLAALGSIRSGLLPLPMVQHRHIAPMHGDIRYPLLGPPLQYNSQPCGLQPQTAHSVSMQQVRLGGRGRRMPRKTLSEDASPVEPGGDG